MVCMAMALCVSCKKDNDNEPGGGTGVTGDGNSITGGHEYVNLGLPSGTLWATCNVGADSPEDYGDYFAWGETEAKSYYDWITYKWCSGSYNHITKYCTDPSHGTVDDKTVLDPEDDAARANWGGGWRMPTCEEMQELYDKCTWEWTTQNSVNGYLVTGRNGNSIFLPAAGYQLGSILNTVGLNGFYWSNPLYSPNSNHAYCMYFRSGSVTPQGVYPRFRGYTVRPVCSQK